MNVQADDRRRSELVSAVGALRNQITGLCRESGRDPYAVTLIAVTKTYPARDVLTLLRLGIRDIGENKDQEATHKIVELDELRAELAEPVPAPRWHFVGQIQSRKCRSIARYAHAVHSVDRAAVATRLADGVHEIEREPLEVFIQLSLDGDPARGGVVAEELAALADAVSARSELRLRGLMAVAPLGTGPDQAFGELASAAERLRRDHPEADAISAGMSGDFDAALRHGATHLRIGTALLGRRRPVFG